MIYVTFAEWCRHQRYIYRESQATVATAVGKSRSWVASLERGEFRPRVEDAALFAAHFGETLQRVLELAGYERTEIDAVMIAARGADGIIPRPVERGPILVRPADLQGLVDQAIERAVSEVLTALDEGQGRAAPAHGEPPRPSQREARPRGSAPEPASDALLHHSRPHNDRQPLGFTPPGDVTHAGKKIAG
jgi:transcriptional regulator with XRE-family HTH domain